MPYCPAFGLELVRHLFGDAEVNHGQGAEVVLLLEEKVLGLEVSANSPSQYLCAMPKFW